MKKIKFLKFLISGGSAAVTEYGTFILLSIVLSMPLLVANTISFLCGLVVSFTLNKYWVFKSTNRIHQEFSRYFLLAIINLVTSNAIVALLVSVVNVSPLIAKLLTMGTIAVWNYVLFSKLVFKTDERQGDAPTERD